MNGILMQLIGYFFSLGCYESSHHLNRPRPTSIMKWRIPHQVHMINIDILLYTQIKRLFSLINRCQVHSVLALAIAHMRTAAELL